MEHVTRYKCQMSGCPIVSTIEAPVCEEHLAQIGQIFLETRSVAGTFLHLREQLAAKQAAVLDEVQIKNSPNGNGGPFVHSVYYVRLDNHIKIGTTSDLHARLRALYVDHNPDLLLAVEPGNHQVESRRHLEFKDERVYTNRELFNPSRRLLAHIADLNVTFGEARALAVQSTAA